MQPAGPQKDNPYQSQRASQPHCHPTACSWKRGGRRERSLKLITTFFNQIDSAVISPLLQHLNDKPRVCTQYNLQARQENTLQACQCVQTEHSTYKHNTTQPMLMRRAREIVFQRQPGRPHQACYISQNTRSVIFDENNRLRQPGRPHQAYKHIKKGCNA